MIVGLNQEPEMEATNSSTNTIMIAATVPTPKRKRAGKPKVKTGCAVCKIRRVKCDETKPECLRCVRFGMKCEGYPETPQPQPRHVHRPLLPRSDAPASPPQIATAPVRIPRTQPPLRRENRREKHARATSRALSASSSSGPVTPEASEVCLPLLRSPFVSRFQNTAESRYFSLFHAKTALHLSGFYSPNLWSHIVLQASEAEPSIRHAVISIGALEMTSASLQGVKLYVKTYSSSNNSLVNRQQAQVKSETEQHHVFALQQYSKAIREMQKLISGSDRDFRTALIASLLIICFETFHGNYESAGKQIATGVRLIESRHELGSPAPKVEEELVNAFTRLEIQTMGHTDPFTMAEHLALKDAGSDVVARIPDIFTSPLEARNYFNVIVRRTTHYGCALWGSSHKPPSSPISETPAKPSLSHFEQAENADPVLTAQKGRYLDELARWQRAFRPLFESAQPGTPAFLPTRGLQMHYLPIQLTIAMFPAASELAYDNYLPLFREVLKLAHLQLATSTHDPMFSFDMQNVWPLFVTAKKCRDPYVRREAIRLLYEWPRREGIYDSVMAARMCHWVMGIEEEGMVGGFVEEGRRAVSVGAKLDNNRSGFAEVWCLIPDEWGRMIRKETIIQWDV